LVPSLRSHLDHEVRQQSWLGHTYDVGVDPGDRWSQP
jgi:hypothetical protein